MRYYKGIIAGTGSSSRNPLRGPRPVSVPQARGPTAKQIMQAATAPGRQYSDQLAMLGVIPPGGSGFNPFMGRG